MRKSFVRVVAGLSAAVAIAGPTGLVAMAAAPPSGGTQGSGALVAVLLGIGIEAHPGYVRISEVLHLENPTARELSKEVTIPLPAGARFVTYHEGLFRPRVEADRIIDRMTIGPGMHRVVYAYSVAGAGEVDLGRRAAMPIDRVDVLSLAPTQVRSDVLAAAPPVTSQGRTYLRATGRLSAPGTLTLAVTGVPALRRWPAPAAAATMGAMLLIGLAVAMSRAGVGGTSLKRFQRSR
ncbi:MAG: hypothetical protein ACRDGN_00130 [bacterium]